MIKIPLKTISIIAGAGGIITGLVADWANNKIMDEKIEEQVNKALETGEKKNKKDKGS